MRNSTALTPAVPRRRTQNRTPGTEQPLKGSAGAPTLGEDFPSFCGSHTGLWPVKAILAPLDLSLGQRQRSFLSVFPQNTSPECVWDEHEHKLLQMCQTPISPCGRLCDGQRQEQTAALSSSELKVQGENPQPKVSTEALPAAIINEGMAECTGSNVNF